jgi:hypothetical protein
LVKESLALMFQMMQLSGEALVQYEELEALLSFAPPTSLPETDWPLVPVDLGATGKRSKSMTSRSSSTNRESLQAIAQTPAQAQEGEVVSSNEVPTDTSDPTLPASIWSNACQQGSSLLLYSINYTRLRVLKIKISALELCHYVFARQNFFLLTLSRPSLCAEKGLLFIKMVHAYWMKKLGESKKDATVNDLKSSILDKARAKSIPEAKSILPPPLSPTPKTGGFTETPSLDGQNEPSSTQEQYEDRVRMIDLWAVVSAVQMTRGCREGILTFLVKSSHQAASSSSAAAASPSSPSPRGRTNSVGSQSSAMTTESISAHGLTTSVDDAMSLRIRDAARHLSDLLHFAKMKLVNLLHREHTSTKRTILEEFRRVSLSVSADLVGWDSFQTVATNFPLIFNSNHSQSDGEIPPQVREESHASVNTSLAVSGGGAGEKQTHVKQQLFGDTIDNLEDVSMSIPFERMILLMVSSSRRYHRRFVENLRRL